MTHSRMTATILAATLVLSACGGDDELDGLDDDQAAEEGQEQGTDEPEDVEELPDGPSDYASLHTEGQEPDVTEEDGEVSLQLGEATGDRIPWVVHNGTDGPISRVNVSGTVLDADGQTLTSGESQGVHPNLVEPGEVAFGFVYAGPDDLPDDAEIADPSLDYTDGVGDHENIVALDVDEVSVGEDQVVGNISNPHDLEVEGPLSVDLACIGEGGEPLDVIGAFADRDSIDARDSASYSIDLYGDELDCAGMLVGASGYNPDF